MDQQSAPKNARRLVWRKLLQPLLFLAIGSVILWLVYRHQARAYEAQCALDGVPADECSLLAKIAADFASVHYGWIGLVLLAFLVSNVSRQVRWQMLLEPMGYRIRPLNGFLSIMLGYFANLGFPRIGEVVRGGTLARYERIPVEKVMGTIVVDRAMDFLSLFAVIGLALALEFDTIAAFLRDKAVLPEADLLRSTWLWGGMAGLALVGGVSWQRRAQLMQWPLAQKVVAMARGFAQGLRSVRQVRRPFWLLVHSLNIWLMYFLMTWLAFFAFEPTSHLPAVAALLVFVFGSLGIVVPSPGGMGTYHAMVIAALALYHVSGDDAFSFANILFFSINIGCNILFGLLALVLLPLINQQQKG